MTRRKDATRRRRLPRAKSQERSDYDKETVQLCREALKNQDLHLLRQLACNRGFVSKELRRQCWPLLLGISPQFQEQLLSPHLEHRTSEGGGEQTPVTPSGSRVWGASPNQSPEDNHQVDDLAEDSLSPSGRSASVGTSFSTEWGPRDPGTRFGVDAGSQGLGHSPSADGGSQGLRSSLDTPCLKTQYEQWHSTQHRDRSVVMVDVERSLWSFTPGMSDERREVLRDQLRRMLNAAVGQHAGLPPEQQVYYYQGLHDVASVLLMELGGEGSAFTLLSRLVVGHLRDCTRESLEPVLELLQLLWPLLAAVDREVAQRLRSLGIPPYFALSWFITWFAHDVRSIKTASRLFDLFLASHPLMPLYLGTTAMHCLRDQLLACSEMHEAHSLLAHLDLTAGDMPPLELLLGQALKLMERMPPELLVMNLDREVAPFHLSVSPWARLDRGVWRVPENPGVSGYQAGPRVRGLQLLLSSLPQWLRRAGALTAPELDGKKRPRSSRPLMVLSLGGMLSVYVVAVVMSYTVMRGPAGDAGGGGL